MAVLAILLSGCQQSEVRPGRPPTVDVEMTEYRFSFDPPGRAGRVVFRASNAGRVEHEMVLTLLPDDLPPIDRQLRSNTRRAVDTIATVPERRPGRDGTFAVDLEAGKRYALICFLTDGDGVQHARKGMSGEFKAG